MLVEIKYKGLNYKNIPIVPAFLLHEDHMYFKLYNLNTMTYYLRMRITTFDFDVYEFIKLICEYTRDNTVTTVIIKQHNPMEAKSNFRLFLEHVITSQLNWSIFSGDRMAIEVQNIECRANVDLCVKCWAMLLHHQSPALTHIRPYVCEMADNEIPLCNTTDPILAMYRYVDICNEVTLLYKNELVTTKKSSVIELDIPGIEKEQLIAEGVFTIEDYYTMLKTTM